MNYRLKALLFDAVCTIESVAESVRQKDPSSWNELMALESRLLSADRLRADLAQEIGARVTKRMEDKRCGITIQGIVEAVLDGLGEA